MEVSTREAVFPNVTAGEVEELWGLEQQKALHGGFKHKSIVMEEFGLCDQSAKEETHRCMIDYMGGTAEPKTDTETNGSPVPSVACSGGVVELLSCVVSKFWLELMKKNIGEMNMEWLLIPANKGAMQARDVPCAESKRESEPNLSEQSQSAGTRWSERTASSREQAKETVTERTNRIGKR